MRFRYVIAVLSLGLAAMTLMPEKAHAQILRARAYYDGWDGGYYYGGGGYYGSRGYYGGRFFRPAYYDGGYTTVAYSPTVIASPTVTTSAYTPAVAAASNDPCCCTTGYAAVSYGPRFSRFANAPVYTMPASPGVTGPPATAETNPMEPATFATSAPSRSLDVAILDGSFDPPQLDVQSGTIVRWTNRSQMVHNVTSRDGQWRSPNIAPGGSFTMKFQHPGNYAFFSSLQTGKNMEGSVVVGANGGANTNGQQRGPNAKPLPNGDLPRNNNAKPLPDGKIPPGDANDTPKPPANNNKTAKPPANNAEPDGKGGPNGSPKPPANNNDAPKPPANNEPIPK